MHVRTEFEFNPKVSTNCWFFTCNSPFKRKKRCFFLSVWQTSQRSPTWAWPNQNWRRFSQNDVSKWISDLVDSGCFDQMTFHTLPTVPETSSLFIHFYRDVLESFFNFHFIFLTPVSYIAWKFLMHLLFNQRNKF